MLKNLPALPERSLCLFFLAVLFLSGTFLHGQDEIPGDEIPQEIRWYRSNASGMTLEPIPSRLAALRNEYCLSVEMVSPGGFPEILLPHYDNSFVIELRVLYEKGTELRRQWIFRDSRKLARLTAAGSGPLFVRNAAYAGSDEEKNKGFIEIRNSEGFLVREFRFEEDLSEWEFRFYYQENTLLRAETRFKEAPVAEEEDDLSLIPSFELVTTDYFRYSRFGSLRSIERVFHGETRVSRTSFPRVGPELSGGSEELATGGIAYSSEFLLDIYSPEGATVSYTFDNRGRILSEIWKDKNGEVWGEFRNIWSAGRLQSILWRSGDDERLVEYEYDDEGNRIVERNFRRGVLERNVTIRDGGEIEEIYMNGRLVLRAFWEKGLKISEERIGAGIRREERP